MKWKEDHQWYKEEIRKRLREPQCLNACKRVLRKHGWGSEDAQQWFSRVTGLTPAGEGGMEELERLSRRQRRRSTALLADLWKEVHK